MNALLIKGSRPNLGPTQSPVQLTPGLFSPGLKRSDREANM